MLPPLSVVPDFIGLGLSQLHLVIAIPAQQLIHGTFSKGLHLLVEFPLDGVRGLPAAFVLRGSAFLHLGHSPALKSGPARIKVSLVL